MPIKNAIFPILLAITLVISGCTSSSTSINQTFLRYDVSGFELDRSQESTLIFIRPGAPTLAQYSSFMVDAVQIDYNTTTSLPSKEPLHVLNASPWSTMSDVENLFDNWAKGIQASLDEAPGR